MCVYCSQRRKKCCDIFHSLQHGDVSVDVGAAKRTTLLSFYLIADGQIERNNNVHIHTLISGERRQLECIHLLYVCFCNACWTLKIFFLMWFSFSTSNLFGVSAHVTQSKVDSLMRRDDFPFQRKILIVTIKWPFWFFFVSSLLLTWLLFSFSVCLIYQKYFETRWVECPATEIECKSLWYSHRIHTDIKTVSCAEY